MSENQKYIPLVVIIGYFLMLIAISYFTTRKSSDKAFFTGDKQSPWYLVAFGMIGASLSGITFISIPGTVFESKFSYMAMVVGYFLGYLVIAHVLLPLYYRLNLTSIYSFLGDRFGRRSYKTGAAFFLLSRIVGASLRLFLVAEVLDIFLFDPFGIPYEIGIVVTVALIWVYTFRGGIKTIVWTDTLQTASMLLAVGITIYYLRDGLPLEGQSMTQLVLGSDLWDWNPSGDYMDFILGVLNGALITMTMTGLDQDMMQKNLTCKNVGESKKNIFWLSVVMIPVNLFFLILGLLIFEYLGNSNAIEHVAKGEFDLILQGVEYCVVKGDEIFPLLSYHGGLPVVVSVVFLIGLVAAAYSSADSALTALTTSFCIDILESDSPKTRKRVHIGMSVVLILVILVFKLLGGGSVIWELFKWAGFTYGPLLGMFAFGIITKKQVNDGFVPLIAIIAPVVSYLLQKFSLDLFNYQIGFEILLINAVLTVIGLFLSVNRSDSDSEEILQ